MSTRSVREFLHDVGLGDYAPRFIEQGVDTVEDLRYERDLDSLVEDVGLEDAHATTFREALTRALASEDGGKETKKASAPVEPTKDDLAKAVAASVAASKARQRGGDEAETSSVGAGFVRMSGAKTSDYAPKLALDGAVREDVNARMGLATEREIEDILRRHAEKDFLSLLNLREVPIDSMGRVEWAGHEAMKLNEIAMRCKLLTLRLDSSRNSHPRAPLAKRAVENVLDLMSHKETRREFLTLAVRRKVDELRAEGKIQGGGHVSFTGVHYGSGAAATRLAEENYVSKDMMNEMPTYDASIHAPDAHPAAGDASASRAEMKKKSAPKVDVSSIRAKLASKSKKPRFM